MNVIDINPSEHFLGTTWVRIANGRTLVGVNEDDSDFHIPLQTGGAKAHTLTTAQIPGHAHPMPHTHNMTNHVHTMAHTHTTTTRNWDWGGTSLGEALTTVTDWVLATNFSLAGAPSSTIRRVASPATGASSSANTGNPTTLPATGGTNTANTSNNTGGGGAHNNLQPYLTTYIWRRTQ